jgi:hypothetical protein
VAKRYQRAVLLFTASDYSLVSFGHCVFCSSSIYGIRLPFGIFWPLRCLFFFYLRHLFTHLVSFGHCVGCLFFFYLRHLITPWYLLATVLSVLLFTASDYPLVSFGHCVVCSSSIYGIWLPFGIFWSLCCLFFFYLRHLITPWYLLVTVLSVLLLFTASDHPLVSFGNCVVCSSI